jgi:hypothetical protein
MPFSAQRHYLSSAQEQFLQRLAAVQTVDRLG